MDLFKKFFLEQQDYAQSEKPVLSLLLRKPLPLDAAGIAGRLTAIEPLPAAPVVTIQEASNTAGPFAEIVFGSHVVHYAAMPGPVPASVVQRCILPTAWTQEVKDQLQLHLRHSILLYSGQHTDPVEQYLALYKVAAALDSGEVLGLVNEPAWTSHPAEIVHSIMNPEMLQVCRESPPLLYWTGFVQGKLEENFWLISRGYHIFGLPDLAWHITEEMDLMKVHDLFHEVFYYAYFEKADIAAGDVLNLDDENFYLFDQLPDGAMALEGVRGSLQIIPLPPDQVEALMEGQDKSGL